MRHPPNVNRFPQGLYLQQVRPMRLQVGLSDGVVQALRPVRVGESGVGEDLAGQRVAVGVQSARSQAEHGVARAHPLAGDYLATLAGPHADADDLKVSLAVEPGHLRRLAAYEGHTEPPAGFRGTADYAADGFGNQSPATYIVEEEKRPGTRGEHVVGAVVDDIRAKRVVASNLSRDEDFR